MIVFFLWGFGLEVGLVVRVELGVGVEVGLGDGLAEVVGDGLGLLTDGLADT